ncbi:ATP-binding protein [Eisenibacter elegans]|jgi:hypothetical protein|uniref:ATP-binding protein n=1 Tax=Eisenibacter elegans TaxID=997 RepID=UPI0004190DC7|nr:ATP-binding protein [Eisenibacter elegans]
MEDIFFVQPDWQLFMNINTLPQQAGVPKYLLPKLVAKELIDNALDIDPKVSIEQSSDADFNNTLVIRNGGRGFPGTDEEIADLFSVRRPLTSSKRLRLPSRGALGNGLRVVTATIYCLQGQLWVATAGRKLQLIPQDDGSTQAVYVGPYEGEGTEITLTIPEDIFGQNAPEWAQLAIQLNQGKQYEGKTHPHWYDSDSFYNLLLATPEAIDLQRFLAYLEGGTGLRKTLPPHQLQKAVAAHSRQEAEALLTLLREAAKPFNPKKLGDVGEMADFEVHHFSSGTFELSPQKGAHTAQIPFVLECFARLDGAGQTQFFVNKTPIIGDVGLSYQGKKALLFGCGLQAYLTLPKLKSEPTVWVNILTPYMPIVSNGKEPDFSALAVPIEEAISKVWQKLSKHLRQQQPTQGLDTAGGDKLPTQKEIVRQHLYEGIAKASGEGQYRYSLRQLYYVLRPFVMQATGRELKYANFNTIITDYEHETGQDLPGVYRDERGTLLHPHTHEEIRLGTKSVEKYHRPRFAFNKILYSEKEGFFEILKEAGFCERHDCALLTSKGFASRAARDVIDLLAETEEELQFFCIHDADLSGTLIYQALQGATKARPERKVRIINLGLEPWEGLQMGLEVETLERTSRKQAAAYISDHPDQQDILPPYQLDKRFSESTWHDWLTNYRIELNAMDTPTFVDWLEQKISPYNQGKVVPHQAYLQDQAQTLAQAQLKAQLYDELLRSLRIEEQVEHLLQEQLPQLQQNLSKADFEKQVRQDLSQTPQQSWEQAFRKHLQRLLNRDV